MNRELQTGSLFEGAGVDYPIRPAGVIQKQVRAAMCAKAAPGPGRGLIPAEAALPENRKVFPRRAAVAIQIPPVNRRHVLRWHAITGRNAPRTSYCTLPQRHWPLARTDTFESLISPHLAQNSKSAPKCLIHYGLAAWGVGLSAARDNIIAEVLWLSKQIFPVPPFLPLMMNKHAEKNNVQVYTRPVIGGRHGMPELRAR